MILNQVEIKSEKPKKLAIFMHGYGANNINLLPVARQLSFFLPDIHFLLPDAPFPYEGEGEGKQWFSLLNRNEENMLKGANIAEEILLTYIDQSLTKYNLDYNQLILMGFSQGAMMSIHCGLRLLPKKIQIVSYSGAIISWQNGLLNIIAKQTKGIESKILLIHGENDEIVPKTASEKAMIKFQEYNIATELYLEKNLGHSISEGGIRKTLEFLQQK